MTSRTRKRHGAKVTRAISGIRHVTFVVSDLDDGIEWFGRMFGARHIDRFDHHDQSGKRFGVVVELDGFPGTIELRVATENYPLRTGFDPITFQVPNDESLDDWLEHLSAEGASPSPIKQRRTGRSIEVTSSDGILIRLFTAPVGGFDNVAFQEDRADH
jgi:catechol 2,3-dioxygenase-like lactoylglutathione lyase family enzyme